MKNVLFVKTKNKVQSHELTDVVASLAAANADVGPGRKRHRLRHAFPSREALESIVADLRAALFPLHFGPSDLAEDELPEYVEHRLEAALPVLEEQIGRGLLFACAHASKGPLCGAS